MPELLKERENVIEKLVNKNSPLFFLRKLPSRDETKRTEIVSNFLSSKT